MNRISKQILQSPQFFPKILVGTLLLYSLVGIPFFVGYVARYLHQHKEPGDIRLPQWNNWLALLVESWELLVLVIVYGVIPMGLSTLISMNIDQWFGNILWIPLWVIPWIPTMLLYLCCPMWIVLSYAQYLKKGTFESMLNYREILNNFKKSGEDLILLTLLLWGVLLIGFPIIGFSLAIATIIYLTVAIDLIENNFYR